MRRPNGRPTAHGVVPPGHVLARKEILWSRRGTPARMEIPAAPPAIMQAKCQRRPPEDTTKIERLRRNSPLSTYYQESKQIALALTRANVCPPASVGEFAFVTRPGIDLSNQGEEQATFPEPKKNVRGRGKDCNRAEIPSLNLSSRPPPEGPTGF